VVATLVCRDRGGYEPESGAKGGAKREVSSTDVTLPGGAALRDKGGMKRTMKWAGNATS
jgi:hypothetical protein